MQNRNLSPMITLFLLCMLPLASAQSTTGSIAGLVKDQSGALIPDAAITVVDEATNVRQTATSGDDGQFILLQLPPGNYTISVEKPGFKKFSKTGGGFIQVVTRGGTKSFHGGVRLFHRHEGLNANRFFNKNLGLDRPLYRYKNIGWDFGGPVLLPWTGFNQRRNKLFFFVNQEFYRQLRPNDQRRVRVPTAAERSGDFSNTTDGNGIKMYIKDPLKTGTCSATKIRRIRSTRV